MSEARDDEVAAVARDAVPQGAPLASSLDGPLTSLRGAAPAPVGRRFWMVAGTLALVILGVVVIVSFLSAANDNSRITRMKSRGIAVSATVIECTGNLGGSGSNAANYTCRGSYTVGSTTYHEVIGSMNDFAAPHTSVRAVADPSRPSTLVLASAVASSRASNSAYLAPALLLVAFVALILAFLGVARRSRRTADPATSDRVSS